MFRHSIPAVLMSLCAITASAQCLPLLNLPPLAGGLSALPALPGMRAGMPTVITLPQVTPLLQDLQSSPLVTPVLQGIDAVIPLPIVVDF